MKRCVLVALLACKSAAPVGPEPIGNTAQPVDAPRAMPTGICTIAGTVVDASNGDLVAGATVVASGGKAEAGMTVSDERGRFELGADRDQDRLTVYYLDTTGEAPLDAGFCGSRIHVAVATGGSSGTVQPLKITIGFR